MAVIRREKTAETKKAVALATAQKKEIKIYIKNASCVYAKYPYQEINTGNPAVKRYR